MKPKPDKCEQCGHEVDLGDDVQLIDDVWICQSCEEDYWEDHPDWERLIEEAEYREDR